MNKIAIFASGSGSNAENIIEFFKKSEIVDVSLVLTNKKDAFVVQRAQKHGVPYIVFTREQFYKTREVIDILEKHQIDFIVLAGFLWLIPDYLSARYKGKMVNIHPALLPKYGGKGMYGMHVHKAVVDNKETESGITIHHVNEEYDKGDIIFQAKCKIDPGDDPGMVAKKVHELEYKHYPVVIERLIRQGE